MKSILLPLLWLAAVLVAVAVLWRMWRGKNVVLRGRFSPQFVRMVVIILLAVGAGAGKTRAIPPPGRSAAGTANRGPGASAALPHTLITDSIARWQVTSNGSSRWTALKQTLVKLKQAPAEPDARTLQEARELAGWLPGRFRAVLLADLEAIARGRPTPGVAADKLVAALDELERFGFFDHWAAAYLWRKTSQLTDGQDRTQLVELYTRLHQHARIVNTLIRARAGVQPISISPRPWRSKAAPPHGYRYRQKLLSARLAEKSFQTQLVVSAGGLYPSSDIGTWQRDGVAVLSIGKGSAAATLIRGGRRQMLNPGQTLRFNRLDLIEAPADGRPVALEHTWLGRIELPVGRLLSVWDLADCLSAQAARKVQEAVSDALAGDEQAAGRLEEALPLTQRKIREALSQSPDAKGAPRLRMILALFDDVPAQGPPANNTPELLQRLRSPARIDRPVILRR